MPPQTPQAPGTNQQIDPTALALSRAIRQVESGDNPNAKGKSGEFGIGQWMPGNFESSAKQFGLDPNDRSQANQEHVMYETIDNQLKQGHSQSEIASWWNSGKYDPTGNVGVNKEGVVFDTPAYVEKVKQEYAKQSQSFQSPATQPQGIGPNFGNIGDELANNIANRFKQGAQAVGNAITSGTQGNLMGAASGALQTAGAVAGGVGDVANAALETVPGVQLAEQGVGSALGSLAKTPLGESLVQGISQWSQQNPEISGDIGAAINIGSLFPLFKGLSLIKGGLTDAASNAFKGTLERGAQTEIRSQLKSTAAQSLARAESRGLNPVNLITSDYKNLPSIVEGQGGNYLYDGTKGATNIQSSLSQDENQLQSMLAQTTKRNVGIDLNQARQKMLKDVIADFPVSAKGGQAIKAVNEFFDNVAPTTGGRSIIDLNELNNLKRDIGGGVNWLNLGVKNGEIKESMYRSLMKQVEEGATRVGIGGVKELNRVMSEKIEALKVLGSITGKTVRQSKVGKIIREVGSDVGGAAAESLGRGVGIPYSSAIGGRGIARLIPGRVPLTATRLLGRNGRGSVQSSLMQGLLKAGTAQALRSTTKSQ